MSFAPVIVIVEPFGGSRRQHNPHLPMLFVDDAAVTRGDGIFETILVRQGRPRNVDLHWERFVQSAELVGLPTPQRELWEQATVEAIGAVQGDVDEAVCTWTYSHGRETTGIPTAWITIKPVAQRVKDQRANGVAVMTSPRGYTIDAGEGRVEWLALSAKMLSYTAAMAALRYAQARGFDDVVYVDGDRILEGTTSTVIAVRGNKLRTPTPGPDVMLGTTQQAVFDLATERGWRCKAKELTYDYLLKSDSVWLVSSVRGPVRVISIDGTKLPAPANEAEVRELMLVAQQGN